MGKSNPTQVLKSLEDSIREALRLVEELGEGFGEASFRLSEPKEGLGQARNQRASRLVVVSEARVARVGADEVDLTWQEFEILDLLVNNPDLVMTYSRLAEQIWPASDVLESQVRNLVWRLRGKLEAAKWSGHIDTIRQVGYRIRKEII